MITYYNAARRLRTCTDVPTILTQRLILEIRVWTDGHAHTMLRTLHLYGGRSRNFTAHQDVLMSGQQVEISVVQSNHLSYWPGRVVEACPYWLPWTWRWHQRRRSCRSNSSQTTRSSTFNIRTRHSDTAETSEWSSFSTSTLTCSLTVQLMPQVTFPLSLQSFDPSIHPSIHPSIQQSLQPRTCFINHQCSDCLITCICHPVQIERGDKLLAPFWYVSLLQVAILTCVYSARKH